MLAICLISAEICRVGELESGGKGVIGSLDPLGFSPSALSLASPLEGAAFLKQTASRQDFVLMGVG